MRSDRGSKMYIGVGDFWKSAARKSRRSGARRSTPAMSAPPKTNPPSIGKMLAPNAVTILNIGKPAREVKRTDAANFPQMRALLVLNPRSRLGLREGTAVSSMLEDVGITCVRDARAPVD